MKQHLVRSLCLAAGFALLPAAASAQSQAYTTGVVNVRAGPASDYPVVTQLPGGVPVSVMGCVGNYQWCDIAAPNLRGWVYAGRLSSPYQGSNVPLMNYGALIGLPILTFSIGDYWGNYYRGRPWYGQQSRWAHHAPPPPPRPDAGRPPGHPGGPAGHVGGRPPGWQQPGHAGGRPPGGQPGGYAGGRPPGGQAPGHEGGRPPGGQPGHAGGPPPGAQPGAGGGRPPGGGNHQPGGPSHGGSGEHRPSGGG